MAKTKRSKRGAHADELLRQLKATRVRLQDLSTARGRTKRLKDTGKQVTTNGRRNGGK